jgi:glucose-6-phosphate isomerase
MTTLPTIDTDGSTLTPHTLASYEYALLEELNRVQEAAKGQYESDYASINLSLDNNHLRTAKRLATKYARTTLLIVVGIGGSNLGTIAVQEAILGKQHNIAPGKRPRVLYADTVDPEAMARTNALLDAELKRGGKALINIISKSGGTTETVANFEILLATLQKHKGKKANEFVVVTTDNDSHLMHFAKENKFTVLPMPKKVGGRYSVLSLVGLFPLAVLGIDIKKLMDGAAHMRAECLKSEHAQNPAIVRAAMLANAYRNNKRIADNFYCKTDLESVGKWYRQLMGESIGKEWNRDRTKQVHMGITPTVSIGSTDLHSMAQLYFGGPNDKFFTLVTIEHWREDPRVPDMHAYDALVPHIQKRDLSFIMNAIADSVAITLYKRQRPYCRIRLHDCKEGSIGALLQMHMMEMIYLAAILDVNPFDQPNVEEYKIETKRILAGSRR